jgi:tetratricopeptide (TPR) repeat protein
MTSWQVSPAHNRLRMLLRPMVFALAVCAVSSLAEAQPASLQTGSSIAREIAFSETHRFEFALKSEQLITLTIFAQDLNLSLRIVAGNGNSVEEIVYRRPGPLTWSFIAQQEGQYQLVITSLELSTQPRSYQLKVEQITSATQRDKKAALAAADFFGAEVLRLKPETADTTRALQRYHLAALAWQQQAQWAEAAGAWQQIGEVHFEQGNYQEALRAFETALQLSKWGNDSLLTTTQVINIGYVHVYLGNLEKASEFFDESKTKLSAGSLGQALLRKRLEAQLQNNYGEVEYGRGNLKRSLYFFARSVSLWQEVDDRSGLALIHLNAGYSYLDSGSVNEATVEFEQALKLWREVGNWRGEARTLTAQGNLYTLLGDNYAALIAHRLARDIFRRIGDQQGEAVTSNGLGKVFEDLNRKQEAIDNYSIALRLNQAIGNKDFEAVSGYYLGRVSRDLGDLARALEYYERSLALSRQSGKSRMAALALMDIAAVYVKQQRFADARRIYEQTLILYKQIADLRRQALIHQGVGELLRIQGQLAQAASEYQQGLDLFQQIKDQQGQAESLYWLARLAQEQGHLNEALADSQKSIELLEIQRARLLGQNWRSSYFASVRRHFELYVDILMQLDRQQPQRGFAALALEASERARARSLLELLAETQSEIRRGVDPALVGRERQLRQQLSAKAAYQLKTLNTTRPNAETADIELEIRNLVAEYDFVQAQIRAQSPAYARLIQPSTVGLTQIQATLKGDKNTLLVEYMLGDERSYVWLVTPTTLIARELAGRSTLENLAREVYQSLTARQRQPNEDLSHYHDRYTAAEERFCPSATQLSQLLLGPLRSFLNEQRLLVVADGNLQYIPFDALPLPAAAGSGQVCRLDAEPPNYVPLLTAFEVVSLPSFSSLAILRLIGASSPRPAREIAVWADPVFESDDPRIATGLTSPSAQKAAGPAPPLQPTNRPVFVDPPEPATRLLATEEEAQSIMRFAPGGLSVVLTGFAANREDALHLDLQN